MRAEAAEVAYVEPIVINRVFKAPVSRVYEAWTNPMVMVQWFSSNTRWNAPLVTADVRPGGEYQITMRHSDGDKFVVGGKYIDVVQNERLSFTWVLIEGPTGKEESEVTLEFRPHPDGTELTLTHDKLADPQERTGASGGWYGCLDMLESCLDGNPLLK